MTSMPSGFSGVLPPTAPRARRMDRRTRVLLTLAILLPTLVAALYYGLIVTPRYVSESKFTIRNSQSQGMALSLGTLLQQNLTSGTTTDAAMVAAYIKSSEMLTLLDKQIGLFELYRNPRVDFFSRFPQKPTKEEIENYFAPLITVVDEGSNILSLRVQAFEPDTARHVAEGIIALTEKMIDDASLRARGDAVEFARRQLTEAEDKLRKTNTLVLEYRQQREDLNPSQSASAILGIVTGLEAELASVRSQYSEAQSFMQPNSVQLRALRARIAALQQQITHQREQFGREHQDSLSVSVQQYENLLFEQDMAMRAFVSSLSAYESAQKEAAAQHFYLVAFVPPNLPEEATEPLRIKSIFTVLVVSLVACGLVVLLVAAIREHNRM